ETLSERNWHRRNWFAWHRLLSRRARLRIVIGIEYWDTGYGTDAVKVLLRLAFENMGCVELLVLTFNERAIACYERCGFPARGLTRVHIQAWLVSGRRDHVHSAKRI
ncbi:MAG: GNAT family N-acetyltransferase, partial [Acidobacteriaceae bacterium]|nr:GNAT family N-acetyltransferase [Acidobacteriaceae bacterium]